VEGDGGVIYSGASLTNGYGMQYRENFVHHSLEVPGLHGRGGIYFDDHEGSVSNCSGNVMFKAAGRAFLVNGGAANNITHNLIVNSGEAIYNQHADDMTRDLPLYDNGTLKRGDKGDYIWYVCEWQAWSLTDLWLKSALCHRKTENALGVKDYKGLFSTPFAKRFPTFARLLAVNSTTEGWASAAGSNFRDNVFLNNSAGICLLTGYHSTPSNPQRFCDGELALRQHNGKLPRLIDMVGSKQAKWADFPGACVSSHLFVSSFWYKRSLRLFVPGAGDLEFVNATLGFNTGEMGLRCDEFRRTIPSAAKYRPWVKARFDGVPSAASGEYTPQAAAIRSSLASGKALVLNFTIPCPPLTKQDCRSIWVAWGECEAGGTQVRRFTVEQDATLGGVEANQLSSR
jgi:hypothetical protein